MADTEIATALKGIAKIDKQIGPLRRKRDALVAKIANHVRANILAAIEKANNDPEIPYRFGSHRLTVRSNDALTTIVLSGLVTKATGKALESEALGHDEPWGERLEATFRDSLGFPPHVPKTLDLLSVTISGYYFEEVEQ